jgi:hypothetical protein
LYTESEMPISPRPQTITAEALSNSSRRVSVEEVTTTKASVCVTSSLSKPIF